VGIADLLREAVNKTHAAHVADYYQAVAGLAENEIWKKLDPGQQTSILNSVGLTEPVKPVVSNDEVLGRHLDGRPLSVAVSERDAIPGRIQQTIERAAKLLEPKVQTIALERNTLRSPQDVDSWLERQKARLLDGLKLGPVLVT
jgi:hypothetical protein